MSNSDDRKYRLLVVDDNRAIHEDFRKILTPDRDITDLDFIEADLFGTSIEVSERQDFSIDSAFQGVEGLELVKKALAEGKPYSLAFIDMRMPPGWNGIETIEAIWEVDPDQQIVICSAYSDHSWAEIAKRLGNSDRLLILKKPFDNIEILQMAYAMSNKCLLARQAKLHQSTADQSSNEVANTLLAPIEELKNGIQSLQGSFNELSEQLNTLCINIAQSTDTNSEKILAELKNTFASADLENRIPDVFSRLESALQQIDDDKQPKKTKTANSTHH